ncbi:hypothetical protein CW751_07470 [Brumimicrobium salinarum]|uniref:Uncharacterized protein n=1 Tax=Brumimicrobium salinarum TaxID=2058658 RepID=A0A2I0R348_9FLAO|nr:hypothetical protein CW751_07470 [Brumimicrobium salinarum]
MISCTSRQEKEFKSEEKQKEVEELSSEEKIIRKIENKLKIPATEEYDIQFLKKYIDADTLIDALILVNREHHAFENVKKAIQNDSLRKLDLQHLKIMYLFN